MGEILRADVRVDTDGLHRAAERVGSLADGLAGVSHPAFDALPGSDVTAAADALGMAFDAAVAAVAGGWRDWAHAARRCADELAAADRDGGERIGG
jgi:hypothetical protein